MVGLIGVPVTTIQGHITHVGEHMTGLVFGNT